MRVQRVEVESSEEFEPGPTVGKPLSSWPGEPVWTVTEKMLRAVFQPFQQ